MTGNASCRRAGANRKSSRLKARQALEGFAFVAPALILTLVFFIYPLINTVSLSFHDTNVVTGQMRNVGLKNYANLLRDSVFWKAAKNTTVYTLIVTPLIFIAAFILALLVNKDRRELCSSDRSTSTRCSVVRHRQRHMEVDVTIFSA